MPARPPGTAAAPGPWSAAAAASRSVEAGLFVRAAAHCIYCAFRGFCRSPAATREIFLFPLCCITWLLFSCCCFFPSAFVDVGCGQGQVTGQDVLLLRGTDMQINDTVFWNFSGRWKVRICTAELSAWLTAQPCITAFPPEPLA